MNYKTWEEKLPDNIKGDSLWKKEEQPVYEIDPALEKVPLPDVIRDA